MKGLRLSATLFLFVLLSCQKDKPSSFLNNHQYPPEVRDILLLKCATPGCHTQESYQAAGGINLSSWNTLFQGSRSGSAIIPFRPDLSSLVNYINTDSSMGPVNYPTMPYKSSPLSNSEFLVIKEWIENGAPNNKGIIKFSGDFDRKKFYVANQGCDLLGVYDSETRLAMRYLDVGFDANKIESPHMVKASPDGKYLFLVFYNGSVLQRIKVSDDTFAGSVEIGPGSWNTVTISSDSKLAYCVDWSPNGKIAVVDIETMSLVSSWKGFGLFVNPHGCSLGPNDSLLYVTSQQGNFIYKVDVLDPLNTVQISLQTGVAPLTLPLLDPHEIAFTPDKTKYIVTCQRSNEVRIMQTSNDSLLAVIPVGNFPQEPVVSMVNDLAFISCMEGSISGGVGKGSVAIINYKTNSFVKELITGYQPHGISVDNFNKLVYVANRNQNPSGPAPHHSFGCAGRNGYLTLIDLESLSIIPFQSETLVDPFSIAVVE